MYLSTYCGQERKKDEVYFEDMKCSIRLRKGKNLRLSSFRNGRGNGREKKGESRVPAPTMQYLHEGRGCRLLFHSKEGGLCRRSQTQAIPVYGEKERKGWCTINGIGGKSKADRAHAEAKG